MVAANPLLGTNCRSFSWPVRAFERLPRGSRRRIRQRGISLPWARLHWPRWPRNNRAGPLPGQNAPLPCEIPGAVSAGPHHPALLSRRAGKCARQDLPPGAPPEDRGWGAAPRKLQRSSGRGLAAHLGATRNTGQFDAAAVKHQMAANLRATFRPWPSADCSSAGSSAGSRPSSKADKSTCCAAPSVISSAMASPVAGALRMPQTLCPVAT